MAKASQLDFQALDLAAGARAATACALPVLIAELSGHHELSWIAIVAFWGCMVDNGGAWRTRVVAMGSFTTLAALGCFLALLVHPWIGLAVLLAFGWSFLASLGRIYGDAAASVGSLLTVTVLVGLGTATGTPAEAFHDALIRAAMTLVGGAWAMLLVLVIWRVFPYGPARRAVGGSWHAVGNLAAALGRLHRGTADHHAWTRVGRERRAAARVAIEAARAVLIHERRRRPGESGRGDILLALLTDVDQVLEALVGLSEVLEVANTGLPLRAQRAIRVILQRIARQAELLATAVSQGRLPKHLDLTAAMGRLKPRVAPANPTGDPLAHAAELLDRVVQYVAAATGMAAGTQQPRRLTDALTDAIPGRLIDPAAALATFGGNFNYRSLPFRHALRLALVAALAEWITAHFQIQRGYWLSITAVVVLQPFMANTWLRTLERVGGTVAGGIVASGIGLAVHAPLVIAALVFPLSVLSMAVRRVSYPLFVVCLTPQFVLIAELFQTGGVPNWKLAGLRAVDTVIGGAVGLAAGFLLWPNWEGTHLPQRLAEGLRASGAYLTLALGGASDAGAARRQSGLALNNAEASLQRLLSEPHRTPPRMAEAAMTILASLRRLGGASAAISLLPEIAAPSAAGSLDTLVGWAGDTLNGIADAVEHGVPSPPLSQPALPPFPPGLPGAELARIQRQVQVIHGAADRLAEASPSHLHE